MRTNLKFFWSILFIFFSLLGSAQNEFNYENAFAELDSFVMDLFAFSDFKEPMQEKTSLKAREDYLSLFESSVYIKDLYNPARKDNADALMPILPIQPKVKMVGTYVEDVARYCDKGVTIKTLGINADYSKISNGEVKIFWKRESSFVDYVEYHLNVVEQITLYIHWVPQEEKYKVYRWEVGDDYKVSCTDCVDRFKETINPADDPEIPIKIWAGIWGGFGMGTFDPSSPDLNQLSNNYADLVSSKSNLGAVSSSSYNPSWSVQGAVQILKGHENQWGLSLGVILSGLNSSFNQDVSEIMYRSQASTGQSFNRFVRVSDAKTDMKLFSLGVPVKISYVHRLNEKLKIYAGLGGNILLLNSISTVQKATIDYEARLALEVSGNDAISIFNSEGIYDVELSTNTLTASQKVNLSNMAIYDLAFDQSSTGTSRINTKPAFMIGCTTGAGWMINSTTELGLGVDFSTGMLKWNSQKTDYGQESSSQVDLGTFMDGAGQASLMNVLLSGSVRFYIGTTSKKQ